MRVLQLIDSLNTGGAERVAVNYANALSSKIDKSYLCVTRQEGLLKDSIKKEVEYLFLNKKSTIDFRSITFLYRFIKSNKINIIHAHSTSYFFAVIVRVFIPTLKIVWHDHYGKSEELVKRPKFVLRFCSRFFNYIISVNSKLKAWAENQLKFKQVSYLPNFAVLDKNTQSTILKGEIGKRIICLANLREQKDHLTLLKSFQEVLKRHSDWTLHLVGKDFNDSYSQLIFKFIKNENLNQQVFVYGSCLDTSAILEQSTIGVLSSKSEGLPLVLLEYGLAGLPVIITNVGDCSKVVSNSNLGALIPSQNTEALSKALLYCIENKKERTLMGRALKSHISNYFSKDALIDKLMLVYYNL